uniref:ZP domain-containing protein n=1 Tax=Heterorhabditis bacteriophora TaxID=37862 RepID=A0A1I7WHP5_HETBA
MFNHLYFRPEEVMSSLFDNPFRPTFKTISPYENQEIIPSATHTSASTQPQLSPFIQPNPLIESRDLLVLNLDLFQKLVHILSFFNYTFMILLKQRKAHVICKEDGIEFSATTVFPFSGQIFANDRKRIPRFILLQNFVINRKIYLTKISVNPGGKHAIWYLQYYKVFLIKQLNSNFILIEKKGNFYCFSLIYQFFCVKIGTILILFFILFLCLSDEVFSIKLSCLILRCSDLVFNSALLRLVNTKLEQKAPLPLVEMKIVVDQHHEFGPEVSEVDIGMPLAVQWRLLPESENKDKSMSIEITFLREPSGRDNFLIVPDHARLRIKCDVAICSDISSSTSNRSNCALIPSVILKIKYLTYSLQINSGKLFCIENVTNKKALQPPFCPDLITSPSNSILYDAEGAFSKRRRDIEHREETQSVKAALCMGEACGKQPIGLFLSYVHQYRISHFYI